MDCTNVLIQYNMIKLQIETYIKNLMPYSHQYNAFKKGEKVILLHDTLESSCSIFLEQNIYRCHPLLWDFPEIGPKMNSLTTAKKQKYVPRKSDRQHTQMFVDLK